MADAQLTRLITIQLYIKQDMDIVQLDIGPCLYDTDRNQTKVNIDH